MDAYSRRVPDGLSRGRSLHGRVFHIVVILMVTMVPGISLYAPGVGAETPSPDAGDTPVLAFTAWRLASLQTAGNDATVPDDPAAFSFVFGEGDAVTVTTDCATATGTIALKAGGAVVPNVVVDAGSTCERRSLPERFVNLLNLSTSWAFDDEGGLVLTLMDGGEIRLAQELTGTTWRWTGFQGGDGVTMHPEADAPTTMVFGADGIVTLMVPCGTVTAPYTLDGAHGLLIDTSALPENNDACMHGARLTLGAMRTYVFRDGKLFISLMADGGIHAFVASAPAG
ncbi:MAG: hypothetical protein QM753_13240 [Thermomicrobiales bacterium]